MQTSKSTDVNVTTTITKHDEFKGTLPQNIFILKSVHTGHINF